MVVALVLGPMMEKTLRQALFLTRGSIVDLVARPLSATILVLAAVSTLIAGNYGQNFDHMPELHWRFGYAYSWAVIVVITVNLIADLTYTWVDPRIDFETREV